MEIAGTVEIAGAGSGFEPGERVFGTVNARRPEGGAQSEFVRVSAAAVVRTPPGVSDQEAVTVPMNGLTVLQALRRLELPKGATLGVTGSAGVVGQYAIELGVQAGLRVIADAKPDDTELVSSFGAHDVVPRTDDPGSAFRAVARDGVDGLIDAAVLDSAALPAIRDQGTLVTVRMWSGPTERRIRIEPVMVASDLERTDLLLELADHLSAGHITTRIAATYPLEHAAEAHARLAAGGVRGRLVLTFDR
jgi:NADPH:quinone reductase-like Zn-dependent oxidoreductase